MYCSFDEDVWLCPETVVADVVACAALDDALELPDPGLFERPWCADAAEFDADATEREPHVDETRRIDGDAGRIDRWARHAHAANGFGG